MSNDYLSLAGRIRQELNELDLVIQRIQRIWRQANLYPDDAYIDAVALNLHAFYAGLERIFELIATHIDGIMPESGRWHIELLRQMASPVPDVRPAVISPELRDRLDRYRGFRHVVRNVYTFNLDPKLVGLLVEELPEVAGGIKKSLGDFADFLEMVGGEMQKGK
jgi:hypothetical protein